MSDNFQSNYKDSDSVKKYVARYNTYSMLFSLGIFLIIVSIIPYFFIEASKLEDKILPTLIIILLGLIIAIAGNISRNSLKNKQLNKYTVAAVDFINMEEKNRKKNFRKDLIISILLIILVPFIYYLIYSQAANIPENTNKYLYSVLILIIAIAVFIILYSKGKKEAYRNLL